MRGVRKATSSLPPLNLLTLGAQQAVKASKAPKLPSCIVRRQCSHPLPSSRFHREQVWQKTVATHFKVAETSSPNKHCKHPLFVQVATTPQYRTYKNNLMLLLLASLHPSMLMWCWFDPVLTCMRLFCFDAFTSLECEIIHSNPWSWPHILSATGMKATLTRRTFNIFEQHALHFLRHKYQPQSHYTNTSTSTTHQ